MATAQRGAKGWFQKILVNYVAKMSTEEWDLPNSVSLVSVAIIIFTSNTGEYSHGAIGMSVPFLLNIKAKWDCVIVPMA